MKQKILCIILSAVLCLTQAAPAFAVQTYEAADANSISDPIPYETEEDAESVPSEGVSEDPETISEAESTPSEIVVPADEIENSQIMVPNPAVEESDPENAEIESTVPSPDIDEAAQQSEQDEELVGATVGLGVATTRGGNRRSRCRDAHAEPDKILSEEQRCRSLCPFDLQPHSEHYCRFI